MKKFIALIVSTVLVICMSSSVFSFAASGYGVVFDELTDDPTECVATFEDAGYTDTILKMMDYGDYIYLGELDLSQYSSVDFTYGCDGGAVFSNEKRSAGIYLTKNGPTQDSNGRDISAAEIIGKAELEDGDGAPWATGEKLTFIDLDTDYSGPVYLAFSIVRINTRDEENKPVTHQDGIVISDVYFSGKKVSSDEGKTATAAPTAAPTVAPTAVPTEAPAEEGCGGVIGGAGIAAFVAAAFVFLKKRG